MRNIMMKRGLMAFVVLASAMWASAKVELIGTVLYLENATESEFNSAVSNEDCQSVTKIVAKGDVDQNLWGNKRGNFSNALTEMDFREYTGSSFPTINTGAYGGISTLKFPNSMTAIPSYCCNDMTNLSSVSIPNGVTTIGEYAFKGCSAITSITLPSSLTSIGSNAFNSTKIAEISIPKGVTTIGAHAFSDCPLTSVTFASPSSLETIGQYAFKNTKLTSVEIPGSVKTIEAHAFDYVESLKTVTFAPSEAETQDPPQPSTTVMHIEKEAFVGCKNITDVYIENLGKITASSEAFPREITFNQGAAGSSSDYATLHYPEGRTEDYVNLEDKLDPETAKDDGKFQKWLVDHMGKAQAKPNGFWEFITSVSGNSDGDPFPKGKFLMTYSHYQYNHLVPKGVKAYIVNHVYKDETLGVYKLELQHINVIPRNTGVILHGETNSQNKQGQPTLALTVVGYTGEALNRAMWGMLQGDDAQKFKNYLVPTATVDGSATSIKSYDLGADGKVAYRNFIMTRYSRTSLEKPSGWNAETDDFVGFFRTKKLNIPSGMAYLQLSATEFPYPSGADIAVLQYPDWNKTWDSSGNKMDETGCWTTATWVPVDEWGVRPTSLASKVVDFGEPIFEEEDGMATLIVPASMVSTDDEGDYYTLQGVKVTNPSKGVFIKNGKKVVLK